MTDSWGDDAGWGDTPAGTSDTQQNSKSTKNTGQAVDDWGNPSGGSGWGDSAATSSGTDNKQSSDGWGSSASTGGGGGWGSSNNSSGGGGWGSGGGSSGGGGGGGGRSCYNCNQTGHMSRDCPEPKKERSFGGGGGGGGRSCYNCGQSGHMSRECPEPKKERSFGGGGGGSGGGGGRACYNCNQTGHMSRECPEPKRERNSGGGGGGGGGWGSGGNSGNTGSSSGGWGDSTATSASNNGTSTSSGWGDPAPSNSAIGGDQKSDSWGSGGGDTAGGTSSGGGWGASSGGDNGGGRGGNDRGCFNCGQPGHMSRDCTEPRKERGSGGAGGDSEDRPAPFRPEEVNLEEEARLQADGVGENFARYKEQQVTCIPEVKPIERFEDVIESKLLLKNLQDLKYNDMTPIQKYAMPAIVDGCDMIGCAQTGSGKTAAFVLPILQNILKCDLQTHDPNSDCQEPYCLIVSPTRELARQIYNHTKLLSKDSLVKSVVIYGQIATSHLKVQLLNGCHILIATLGRLKDFVERGWIGFKNIKYIVLDEGDRLIDDGFKGDIETIFAHPSMPPKQERQTLFFSATFKKEIQADAANYLSEKFIFLAVGKIGSSNEDIKQEFLQVSRAEKKQVLKKILREDLTETDRAIIFTQTKQLADILAGIFTSEGLLATSIHGDRHQHQREEAINLFRTGKRRFLISSPVGNRGLDLPKVAIVINYDLPSNIDEYVHRIGRTGRAGHLGRAISFVDLVKDAELIPDLLKNLQDAKQEIPGWLDGGSTASAGFIGGGEADDWGDSAPINNNISTSAADDDWGNDANGAVKVNQEAPTSTSQSVAEDDWSGSNGQKRQAEDDSSNPAKKLDLGEVRNASPTGDGW